MNQLIALMPALPVISALLTHLLAARLGRRVARLYAHRLFACRHCLRLNYASQQANKRDRALNRSWDLRRALGCDKGPLFLPAELIHKPKGMHWQTFGKKIKQLKRVDARVLEDAAAQLESIERSMNIAWKALSRC